MSLDSKNSNPESSPNNIVIFTPSPSINNNSDATATAPTGNTSSSQITSSPTKTPVPTQSTVTAVPGGKTSTNPNYAGKKIISITFDDGPHPSNTTKVLDMLKSKG